ncbi:hypothetical protein, conserved [Eimeria tenella]|uniref:Uncharacterized protein n=1 Tax=Eimeria tenella TaxID=5802 RepID=U6L0Y8_EIMTE|nr:hypothetical protein, conserved [Eimeria tenella]CDJ42863.1 hypothetical protein, conserved [Eimeria tenella]|eukprot:XP_013233613.1 hypothetical protein, conserved [Eimeria tenella]
MCLPDITAAPLLLPDKLPLPRIARDAEMPPDSSSRWGMIEETLQLQGSSYQKDKGAAVRNPAHKAVPPGTVTAGRLHLRRSTLNVRRVKQTRQR